MLASGLRCSRCRSLKYLLRGSSRAIFQHSSIVVYERTLFTEARRRGIAPPFDLRRSWNLGHVFSRRTDQHQSQTANLSTPATESDRSRQARAKYLKPRKKPKFRLQTQAEYDELVDELKRAQDQYESQNPQQGVIGQESSQQQQSVQGTNENGNTFVSPFFSSPDFHLGDTVQDLNHRHNTDRPTKAARNPLDRFQVSRAKTRTTALEQELYHIAHNDPDPKAIHHILRILVQDRKTKPKSQYYEAWILANTWPEYGSASNVKRILQEMEAEGIDLGANIIAAVLKVLAIHPSPDISHQMIQTMERRWLPLSSQSKHHLILGMIRTGQLELASWSLDTLRSASKPLRSSDREIIPDYLIVLLLVEMVRMQDWEGVLRYLYKLRNRRAADRDMPVAFWGWILERASEAALYIAEISPQCHVQPSNNTSMSQNPQAHSTETQISLNNPAYHVTKHIYTAYVTSMSLRPTHATLVTILRLASHTGTPWLAHNVAATMTYVNGIDDRTGQPLVPLSSDELALVTKATSNHEQALRAAGRDLESEREEERCIAAEQQRIRDEDKQWWEDLYASFDAEKESDNSEAAGDAGKAPDTAAAPPSKHTDDIEQDQEVSCRPFAAFDRNSVPPGNLWPLFPSIGKYGSAYVDPWEALGPRSSARRKWTEAQEYYKQVERAQQKKKY